MKEIWFNYLNDPLIIGELFLLALTLICGYFWLTRTEVRADEYEYDND